MFTEGYVLQIMREGLFLLLLISAPAILVSLLVGVAISLLQAMTQIQDHTLSFVPKLVAVLLALAVASPWIGAQLLRFTQTILQSIPHVR